VHATPDCFKITDFFKKGKTLNKKTAFSSLKLQEHNRISLFGCGDHNNLLPPILVLFASKKRKPVHSSKKRSKKQGF
jgi:hypothetical protein